jgi:methyl-accepting chemotaxis protein
MEARLVEMLLGAAISAGFVGSFGWFGVRRWRRRREIYAYLARELAALSNADFMPHDAAGPSTGVPPAVDEALARARAQMSGLIAHVKSGSIVIALEGNSLLRQANELAARTEEQAAALEETSAAVQQLTASVGRSVIDVDEIASACRSIDVSAAEGRDAMEDTKGRLQHIERASRRVADLVAIIDDIALQTNLLAMNAAAEAARAGESGRGFSVIASEVRSLATRSAESAREVRQAIKESDTQMGLGSEALLRTAGRLEEIVSGIRGLATRADGIASTSKEQGIALAQVAEAVRQIDTATQHNAVLSEGMTRAAELLEVKAKSLADSTAHAKLQQGTADEAYGLVQRAIRHHDSVGLNRALRDFNATDGAFVDRDLYVIVSDMDGTFLSFAPRQEMVGKSMGAMPGLDAERFLTDARTAAASGGGWVEFQIKHPVTGQMTEKVSYFTFLQPNRLLVGCGFFKAQIGV